MPSQAGPKELEEELQPEQIQLQNGIVHDEQ